MKNKALSILGTGSDVGKSYLVTGLCRLFHNMGYSVAPFKAQNMSNNSFVTQDGLEMGRAQVVQAEASRIEPTVHMNPILLKPSGESTSQLIVHGKIKTNYSAKDYYKLSEELYHSVEISLENLQQTHELLILEGAGSCSEVNLRDRDIVNFRPAHTIDAPVVLIADIEKGGVFAQIIGTLEVIPHEDRNRIKGIIINKFRGDKSLFTDGIQWLEERTQLPILGVLPYNDKIHIDAEDCMNLNTTEESRSTNPENKIHIAIIQLPRISNHTDFHALQHDPNVELHYLSKPKSLDNYDLTIIPGSKNVCSDMEWLSQSGWAKTLQTHAKQGGNIGGICGGYQIMGQEIADPLGLEGSPRTIQGLNLLPVKTTLQPNKILTRCTGIWTANDQPITGYEIHIGETEITSPFYQPALKNLQKSGKSSQSTDGIIQEDQKLWGTYLHGLFDSSPFRQAFLHSLNPSLGIDQQEPLPDHNQIKDQHYNSLANFLETHLDIKKLSQIIGI